MKSIRNYIYWHHSIGGRLIIMSSEVEDHRCSTPRRAAIRSCGREWLGYSERACPIPLASMVGIIYRLSKPD